jgi:pantetheine-phosphate adenylyltransferase
MKTYYNAIEKRAIDKIKSENWRHYHSFSHHIEPMVQKIMSDTTLSDTDRYILRLAAIYHDVVYDPLSNDNEELSNEYFLSNYVPTSADDDTIAKKVSEIILATKSHKSSDPLVRKFLKLDISNFEGDFSTVIKNQMLIRKEYQVYELNEFKAGSTAVLKSFLDSDLLSDNAKDNLRNLIEFLKTWIPNIYLFAGSFNPMHVGHMDIIKKAEQLADEVIIVFAKNYSKDRGEVVIPECLKYHRCIKFEGAINDLIVSHDYPITMVRGLRNTSDFQAEMNYQTWLKKINPNLNIVNLFASPELIHVSSTAVLDMIETYGIDHPLVKESLIY